MRTGPSTFEPVVIPFERILRLSTGELILLSIQGGVTMKFKEPPMVGIAARLGEHIHLRALVPILRWVNADLNFELLIAIEDGRATYVLKFTSIIVDSVERVVIEENALTTGGYCLLGAFATLAGARCPAAGASTSRWERGRRDLRYCRRSAATQSQSYFRLLCRWVVFSLFSNAAAVLMSPFRRP